MPLTPLKNDKVYSEALSLLGNDTRKDFHIDGKNSACIFKDGGCVYVTLTTSSQTHKFRVSKEGHVADWSSPRSTIKISDVFDTIKTKNLPSAIEQIRDPHQLDSESSAVGGHTGEYLKALRQAVPNNDS